MPRSRAADEYRSLCGGAVVSVSTLMALGVPRSTVASRCRAGGPWTRLGPAVVKLDNGPPTRSDRRRAAVLLGGAGSLITGLDGLGLHGFTRCPPPSGPVHLLVPDGLRRSGHGLALLERTARLPESAPGRWPLAPAERAVLDACRRLRSRDEVRATMAEAVQSGRCDVAALATELTAGSGRGTALPRAVLAELAAGVRSAAEASARDLVHRAGLPDPVWNAWLYTPDGRFVACVDAWFADAGLVWEIDSRTFHLSPADHERTVEHNNALVAAGLPVLQTIPTHLHTRPAAVITALRNALASRAPLPLPAITASPERLH